MNAVDRFVAISISNAPDFKRLGFPHREVDRVLMSVCTALVRSGSRIVYGGNLDPTGYTFKIFRHLAEAYAVRKSKAPFIHVVPEPVLRRANFDDFSAMLREARGIVETRAVFADNRVVALQPPADPSERKVLARSSSGEVSRIDSQSAFLGWLGPSLAEPSDAYSAARNAMASMTVGRVLMGGKMGLKERSDDRYEGAMPGVVEEALMTLSRGQALFTLGAFGGATRDVAIALNLMKPSMKVPRGPQDPTYQPSLEKIAGLANQIPSHLHEELSQIALDDRAEPLSFAIVRVLQKWQGSVQ